MKHRDEIMRVSAFLIFMLLASFFVSPNQVSADAWLWKFNVPIELKNIPPELKYVGVVVKIFDSKQNEIAFGKQNLPIGADGSLFQVATIYIYPADMYKGHYPGEGVSYLAAFDLGQTANGIWYMVDPPASKAVDHKPGTEFLPKAGGNL